MMISTTKMSSKGQVVIPQDIREEIGADEGTVFVITNTSDTLVLKKVPMPSKEELINQLKKIAKEGTKRAEKLGIKESDIPELVHNIRKSKKIR